MDCSPRPLPTPKVPSHPPLTPACGAVHLDASPVGRFFALPLRFIGAIAYGGDSQSRRHRGAGCVKWLAQRRSPAPCSRAWSCSTGWSEPLSQLGAAAGREAGTALRVSASHSHVSRGARGLPAQVRGAWHGQEPPGKSRDRAGASGAAVLPRASRASSNSLSSLFSPLHWRPQELTQGAPKGSQLSSPLRSKPGEAGLGGPRTAQRRLQRSPTTRGAQEPRSPRPGQSRPPGPGASPAPRGGPVTMLKMAMKLRARAAQRERKTAAAAAEVAAEAAVAAAALAEPLASQKNKVPEKPPKSVKIRVNAVRDVPPEKLLTDKERKKLEKKLLEQKKKEEKKREKERKKIEKMLKKKKKNVPEPQVQFRGPKVAAAAATAGA
ncbi:mediator of RNA polymerase II transcription subunit 1.1-like isoform X1, partial [Cricetulus griseus]